MDNTNISELKSCLIDIVKQLRIMNGLKVMEMKASEKYNPDSTEIKKMNFTDNLDFYSQEIYR